MSPYWIKAIADSKDVALIISLLFNGLACMAIRRLWKSREELQKKITDMLIELTKEINRRYWSEKSGK